MAGGAEIDDGERFRLQANANLVDSLGSATRHGGAALAQVPELLRRLLEEGAWREFITQRGDRVTHASWRSFVTTPPLAGLGTTDAVIDRICSDDPHVRRMLRDARKVGRGRRTDLEPGGDSPRSHGSGDADYQAQRLARDHPDEYAAVERGEKSINRAAVDAGITRKRIAVRLDDPVSAARTLRAHMDPALIAELVALLISDDTP